MCFCAFECNRRRRAQFAWRLSSASTRQSLCVCLSVCPFARESERQASCKLQHWLQQSQQPQPIGELQAAEVAAVRALLSPAFMRQIRCSLFGVIGCNTFAAAANKLACGRVVLVIVVLVWQSKCTHCAQCVQCSVCVR